MSSWRPISACTRAGWIRRLHSASRREIVSFSWSSSRCSCVARSATASARYFTWNTNTAEAEAATTETTCNQRIIGTPPSCERFRTRNADKLRHADRLEIERTRRGAGAHGGAQLAERARGLAAVSASPGSTGRRVSSVKVGGAAAVGGAWREPRASRLRSCRKRFTMRSSSEWKDTTTRRPPSASTASAAASAVASSSSSRLMKMRSAWKVRVAGWMCDAPAGPAARATISAS